MYNSQYYTCEQIDQRLLQGYVDDYNSQNNTQLTKAQFLNLLHMALSNSDSIAELSTALQKIEDMTDLIDDEYQGTKTVERQMIKYKAVNGEYNGVQISTSGDGEFTLSGTSTSGTTDPSLLSTASTLEAGTYKYSIEVLEGSFPDGDSLWRFACGSTNDNQKISYYFRNSPVAGVHTFVANSNYRLYFSFVSGKVFNVTFRLKVYKEETVAVNRTAKDEKARAQIRQLLPLESLGEEVAEIKNSYPIVKEYKTSDLKTGDYFYNLNGLSVGSTVPSPTGGNNNFGCIKIGVKKGQHVEVYTNGGQNGKAYAVTDVNNVIVDTVIPENDPAMPNPAGASVNTISEPYKAEIGEDGYLFVNVTPRDLSTFKVIVKDSIVNGLNKVNERLQEVAGDIDDIKESYPQVVNFDKDDIYIDNNSYKQYYWSFSSLSVGDTAPSSRTKDTSSTESSRFASIDPIKIYKGQKLTVYTKGGQSARAYAITDKNKIIKELAASSADKTTTPYTYTVGEDGYLYVNCQWGSIDRLKVTITDSIVDSLNNLKDKIGKAGANTILKINNVPFNPQKSKLRILSIGNSFTVDTTEYLSGFIASAGVDVDDLCVYRLVLSSGSFKLWTQRFNNDNNTDVGVKRVAGNITRSFAGIRAALCNFTWDLITIQQVSTYSGEYAVWEGNGDGGYLKEFIGIIKAYQPDASIGFILTHATTRNGTTIEKTGERHAKIAESCKWLVENYGISVVIPYGTAIENLRNSEVNTTDSANFTRDEDHLGYGLARYTAAACYYHTLIAPRYGKSVLGNSSLFINSETPQVAVTAETALIAQKAALLACSDMYSVNNPDDYNLEVVNVGKSNYNPPATINDLEGKEDKTVIGTLSLNNNQFVVPSNGLAKYYNLGSVTVAATIVLPNMANESITSIVSCIFLVTIGTGGDIDVSATQDIYESGLSSTTVGKTYEINAVYNGTSWYVTAVELTLKTS